MKLLLNLLYSIVFSLVLTNIAIGQWALQAGPIEAQIKRGIENTYNMDYALADRTFDSVIAADQEHPSGYFFKAMVNFWRAITNTDNTGYDEAYRQQLDLAIEKADKRLEENEFDLAGLFYKGASLGMRARIFAIRPNWQDAVGILLGDAKEGIKYLNLLEERIPANGDVLFGRGLYNFYVEAVKEDNASLAPIIGMFAAGNKRAGLQMLELAAQRATYSRVEAKYELMKIFYLYEKNYQASYPYSKELATTYPNNSNFLHYLGFNQYSLGMINAYDSTYRVMLTRARAKKEGYTIKQAREAMYFIGAGYLNKKGGNLDSALYYLYNSNLLSHKITPKEATWWVTKSELLMGMAYDARGDRKNALMMYNRVLQMKDGGGAHADARRYSDNPYKRN